MYSSSYLKELLKFISDLEDITYLLSDNYLDVSIIDISTCSKHPEIMFSYPTRWNAHLSNEITIPCRRGFSIGNGPNQYCIVSI